MEITKKQLEIELFVNQLNKSQVAKKFGISRGKLYKYLILYNISKKGFNFQLDRKWLIHQYITLNKTKQDIALEHPNSRVTLTIIRNNIKRLNIKKSSSLYQESIQKTKCQNGTSHLIEGHTTQDFVRTFEVCAQTVKNFLRENPRANLRDCEIKFSTIKSSITDIESQVENDLGLAHYNKKPLVLRTYRKPDFKLSETCFLNVDGLYWHSNSIVADIKHHLKLREEFENSNLRLLQFRADEILDPVKWNIVKSMINNQLNKSIVIYGRHTQIQKISQKMASSFLLENHLMGTTMARHLGIFQEDHLVGILSYKCYKGTLKIERFCSKCGVIVLGGFSKALAYLLKRVSVTGIEYWVDLRYGTGNYLKNLGFHQEKVTLGWKWTDFKKTYNRLKCRANMDSRNLTESAHAQKLGWVKIYDAGQAKFFRSLL